MKIGDRVTYNDNVASPDPAGTVVEPTEEDLAVARRADANDVAVIGPEHGDVVVEWDDGERYWEHPSYLVVLGGAES